MAPHLTACRAAPDTLLARPAARPFRSSLAEWPWPNRCRSRALLIPSHSLRADRLNRKVQCVSDVDGSKKGRRKGKRTKRIANDVSRDGRNDEKSATIRLRRAEDSAINEMDVRNAWTFPVTIAAALMAGAASALFLGPIVMPGQQKVEDDVSMERLVARQLTKRLQEMQPDELAAILQDIMGSGKLSAPDLKASAAVSSQSLQELSSAAKNREPGFKADQDIEKTREDQKQGPSPVLSRLMGAEMAAELEGEGRVTARRGQLEASPSTELERSRQAVDRGKQEVAGSYREENVQSLRLSGVGADQEHTVGTNSAVEEAGADLSMQEALPPGEETDVTLERLRVAGIDVDSLLALRPKSGLEASTPQDTDLVNAESPAGSVKGPLEAAVEQVKRLRVDLDALLAPARGALRTVEFENALQAAQTALKSFGPAQALESLKENGSLQALQGLKPQELPIQAALLAGAALTGSLVIGAYQIVSRRRDGDRGENLFKAEEGEAGRVAWKRTELESSDVDPSISQDKTRRRDPAQGSRSTRSGLSDELARKEDVNSRRADIEPLWMRKDDAVFLDVQRSSDVKDEEQAKAADLEEQPDDAAFKRLPTREKASSTEVEKEGSERLGNQQEDAKVWSIPRKEKGQAQERSLQGSASGNIRLSNDSANESRPSQRESFRGGTDLERFSERGSVSQLLGRRKPKLHSRGLDFLRTKGEEKRGHSEGDEGQSRADSFRFQRKVEPVDEVVVSGEGARREVRGERLEEQRREEWKEKGASNPFADSEREGTNGKMNSGVALPKSAMQGPGGSRIRRTVVEKATVLGHPEQEGAPRKEHFVGEASRSQVVPALSAKAVENGETLSLSDSRSRDCPEEEINGRLTEWSGRGAFVQRERARKAGAPSKGLLFWATEKGDAELSRSPFLLATPEGRIDSRHTISSIGPAEKRPVLEDGLDAKPKSAPLSVGIRDNQNGSVVRERAPMQNPTLSSGQLDETQSGRRYARLSLGGSSTVRSNPLEGKEATQAEPRSSGVFLHKDSTANPNKTNPDVSEGQSGKRRLSEEVVQKSLMSSHDGTHPDNQAASVGAEKRTGEISRATQRASVESGVQEQDKVDEIQFQDENWREAFRLSRLDVWAEKSV